jgi:hypothetical protein
MVFIKVVLPDCLGPTTAKAGKVFIARLIGSDICRSNYPISCHF